MGGMKRRRRVLVLLVSAALAAPACATRAAAPSAFRLVPTATPVSGSAGRKIEAWQAREGSDSPVSEAAPPDSLGASYEAFVQAERRELAERVRAWIQSEAVKRYVPDVGVDQWPTFREVTGRHGDDCDGLELLALHALRALGFPDESLFRAVIERQDDGTQHMVTLWLASPEQPLVIDPTGFATRRIVPLAALDAWRPRAVFNEKVQYGVLTSVLSPAGAPD